MDKLNVVFFGTPDFSVGCLKTLFENDNINISYVITMPDRPAGRGKQLKSPPVADFAKEHSIPLLQTSDINKETEFLSELKSAGIDFYIVVAFAQFLSTKVLDIPRLGPFNIHTSELPKYRGAAPIQYALLNGDKHTAVTIQKMVKQMDAGDIAHTHPVIIDDEDTSESLFLKLKSESQIALSEFISKLLHNKISYIQQDHSKASFAPTISKKDGYVDFTKVRSSTLKNMFRAFYPWPGLYFYLNEIRVKILEVTTSETNLPAGEINLDFGGLNIGCVDGSVRLTKVQAEGKKPNSDIELINSFKNKFGELKITNKDI